MRIIAGKYKGRKLNTFDISTTRPTSDMVRESLFNKIGYKVDGSVFLDLFCGTGACGIEAISRGAKICYFVDQNVEAIKLTKKNLAMINADIGQVVNAKFDFALKKFKSLSIKFDLIFLDPPYATDFAERAIEAILKYDLLAEDGLIIWEHNAEKNQYINTNFAHSDTKKYGEKYLTYISHTNE